MISRRVIVWGGLVLSLLALRGLLALTQTRYEPPGALLEFDPERVDRVELASGEARVVLEREGEGWVVASAGGLPAHAGVGALIERLAGWRRERVAGDAPREGWGVSGAGARRVTLAAGTEVLAELLVGQVTGIEAEDVREVGYALDTSQLGLFVRRPDEQRVYVVTDFVTRELEPDPRRWFAPPVPLEAAAIARVQRAGPEGYDLRPGPFRFANDPTPVDPRAAGSLWSWFAGLRVVGLAPEDAPTGGATYRLEAGGGALELSLGSRDGRGFLALGGRVLEVEPLAADRLLQATREALIRRALALSSPRDVVRVEVTRGELQRAFVFGQGGWLREDGAPAGIDVSATVAALGQVQVRWGEPATGKLASAGLSLIDARGNVETLWLLDGAPAGGERIALSEVSLVAEVEGRPLSEALRALLGE
ncbi:MAG: DUF4340 domain-containing protein [Planctomycetota bacterium]